MTTTAFYLNFNLLIVLSNKNNNIVKFKGNSEETKTWTWNVTEAIIKGLIRGEKDFGTKVNLVATCIRGMSPLWLEETIEIAADKSFHGGKIVAIDIAAIPSTADGLVLKIAEK